MSQFAYMLPCTMGNFLTHLSNCLKLLYMHIMRCDQTSVISPPIPSHPPLSLFPLKFRLLLPFLPSSSFPPPPPSFLLLLLPFSSSSSFSFFFSLLNHLVLSTCSWVLNYLLRHRQHSILESESLKKTDALTGQQPSTANSSLAMGGTS